MSRTRDLPLTDAGHAAVERHCAALAGYDNDPGEWEKAYPGMVGAVIDAYARRLRALAEPPRAGYRGQDAAGLRAALGAPSQRTGWNHPWR